VECLSLNESIDKFVFWVLVLVLACHVIKRGGSLAPCGGRILTYDKADRLEDLIISAADRLLAELFHER
jgi:hypothetical protein